MTKIKNIPAPRIIIPVDGDIVPKIIGEKGAKIKSLKERFNCKLEFLGKNKEKYAQRTLEISGISKKKLKDAEIVIRKIIAEAQKEKEDPVEEVTTLPEEHNLLEIPKYIYMNMFTGTQTIETIKSNNHLTNIEIINEQRTKIIRLEGPTNGIIAAKAQLEILVENYLKKLEEDQRNTSTSSSDSQMEVKKRLKEYDSSFEEFVDKPIPAPMNPEEIFKAKMSAILNHYNSAIKFEYEKAQKAIKELVDQQIERYQTTVVDKENFQSLVGPPPKMFPIQGFQM